MRPDFRLHVERIVEFLRYVVIKFDYFESYLNEVPAYADRDDINPNDKSTFPYYRIMVGDPTLATTALEGYNPDTLSYIPLTPDNLETFPNMKAFYTDNLSNMNYLLEKYPNDKYLITRMFGPVSSIQAAIDADNFTVLYYPEGKLDEYEIDDIVLFIQQFAQVFNYRWYMNTMEYEELYPMAMWSLLWYLLPNVILTKRLINLRTFRVHPFYIWEYLQSKGYANYNGYFSREQEHFLYRNDNYIKQHVGKKFILDMLQEVFLKPIKHTLREKVILCHTEDSVESGLKYSDVMNKRGHEINFGSLTEFSTFLTHLYNQGYDVDNTPEYQAAVTEEFQFAPCNTLQTKYLELLNNNTNEDMMLLMKFLLDSLCYLVSEGLVSYRINFSLPSTGAQVFDLPVIECLNLMYYCIYQAEGIVAANTITSFTITSALAHTEQPVFPEFVFVTGHAFRISASVDIDDVIGDVPYCTNTIFSPNDMSEFLAEQFDWLGDRIDKLEETYDTVYHETTLALLTTLVPEVKVLNIPQPHSTFAQLFDAYPEVNDLITGINSPEQYDELLLAVFEQLIPLNIGFAELANSEQNSIVVAKIKELFTYLTSYNITFLTSDTDRMDVYRLPPLVLQIGRAACHSTLYSFGDPMNHGAFQLQLFTTSLVELSEEIGIDTTVTPAETSFVIETESAEETPTPESFFIPDGSCNIYYEDFGIWVEIEEPLP